MLQLQKKIDFISFYTKNFFAEKLKFTWSYELRINHSDSAKLDELVVVWGKAVIRQALYV